MYFRIVMVDPVDESEREIEGLYTADEIKSLQDRYYERPEFTDLICGKPAKLDPAVLEETTA